MYIIIIMYRTENVFKLSNDISISGCQSWFNFIFEYLKGFSSNWQIPIKKKRNFI